LTAHASETFAVSLGRIQSTAVAMLGQLRESVDPTGEVELEFGIQLSGELGPVVAKAAGDANSVLPSTAAARL